MKVFLTTMWNLGNFSSYDGGVPEVPFYVLSLARSFFKKFFINILTTKLITYCMGYASKVFSL